MTKLFGEGVNSLISGSFIRGMASTFDFTGQNGNRKIREYLEQDPEVANSEAILSDLEAVALDDQIVRNNKNK